MFSVYDQSPPLQVIDVQLKFFGTVVFSLPIYVIFPASFHKFLLCDLYLTNTVVYNRKRYKL